MAPKTNTNNDPNAGENGAAEGTTPGRTVRLVSQNGIRRAGIRFPAGQPVDVDIDKLTEAQMKALEGEPELRPVR